VTLKVSPLVANEVVFVDESIYGFLSGHLVDVVEDGPAHGQNPDNLGAQAAPEAVNDEAGAREGALGLGT